jgi:hypothetical protein
VINSRRVKWASHVAHIGEKRTACMVVVLKPEEQIPFGRHRSRCDDNIEMDLQEIG